MKVWVLRNPDGSFRARFHRHDAFDCPGRRRYEESYPDRDDYVLVDIEELPDAHLACQFETCFAGRENAAALKRGAPAVLPPTPRPRPPGQQSEPSGIAPGHEVECTDLSSGETVTWTIVSGRAPDRSAGEVSAQSPIGTALIGRQTGETVAITLPRGERHVQIVEVRGEPS